MRLLNLLGCFLSPVALGHLPLEHFLLEGLPVIVSDRSSPSRVRFAASRPGRLRADPKDATRSIAAQASNPLVAMAPQ